MRPLGAAVVHELHRLFPAPVLEQHDRVVAVLTQVPLDRRPDPLLRPVDDPPHHPLATAAARRTSMSKPPTREPELEDAAERRRCPVVSSVHQPASPSTVVSASYTFSGVASLTPTRCRMSTISISSDLVWCVVLLVRWIASAIRLIRCSRASQADPTEDSWATARASWASSTR